MENARLAPETKFSTPLALAVKCKLLKTEYAAVVGSMAANSLPSVIPYSVPPGLNAMPDHGAALVEIIPAFVAVITVVPKGSVVISSISERRGEALLTLTRKAGPFPLAWLPAQIKTANPSTRKGMSFPSKNDIMNLRTNLSQENAMDNLTVGLS